MSLKRHILNLSKSHQWLSIWKSNEFDVLETESLAKHLYKREREKRKRKRKREREREGERERVVHKSRHKEGWVEVKEGSIKKGS